MTNWWGTKFHRFVILCIFSDTPSENTRLWQLPNVSSVFINHINSERIKRYCFINIIIELTLSPFYDLYLYPCGRYRRIIKYYIDNVFTLYILNPSALLYIFHVNTYVIISTYVIAKLSLYKQTTSFSVLILCVNTVFVYISWIEF